MMTLDQAYMLTRLAESNEFRCFLEFVETHRDLQMKELIETQSPIVAGSLQAIRRMNLLFSDAKTMVMADVQSGRRSEPGSPDTRSPRP